MKPIKKPLFIASIVLVVLLPLVLLLSTIVYSADKTLPNTYVLDRNYSNLTHQQIIDRLDIDFPLPPKISLSFENQEFSINLSSISASIDKQVLADNLLRRNLNYGLEPVIKSFFSNYSFPVVFIFDPDLMENEISSISAQIDKPFVPTELHIDPKSKTITAKIGELGRRVDTDALLLSFENHLINWQHQNSIDIPVAIIGSTPTPDQIDSTKAKAANLLNKSLSLRAPTPELPDIVIDDLTLISWLNFEGNYHQDKVNDYVDNISQSLQKDPVDAIFKFEEGRVTEFRPAADGHSVKKEELPALIINNLNALLSSPDSSLTLDIPTQTTPPSINTQDANNLGIKELLGRGVSTFKHSSTVRNFNIEKGASIVNRVLVPPGETFSFLKHLGEVTREAGYKEAYIIRQGRTELDVGGGICQVSTTLFRAMLNAGVNITQRRPHAFRVSYYEEDSPPGYDATVFIPSPDLAFVNDTNHHLLVQNTYDSVNKRLTYEIYGTSDGRQVEINNYRKWGHAPPPPTRYIDDPTLEPGKLIQEETAVPGLNVAFDWKVTRGQEVLHQKTFQSNYVPWAAVYRRGI